MPTVKTIQRSFWGGEIGPLMQGRRDDPGVQNGLDKCENFICYPQGPVAVRPGFEFVSECGKPESAVRLIPFIYNSDQTMVIELGDRYARFHSFGAVLQNQEGTGPYEVVTPWSAKDLFELSYAQSGDVLTVCHSDYPPTEIKRYGAQDWRVEEIVFNSTLSKPTNARAVRKTAANSDPNSDKYKFKYRVSALNASKTEESEPSDIMEVTANLYAFGTTVEVSCDPVPGAKFYRFYKSVGGLYGYIGDSDEPSIIDDNIHPKQDITIKRFDEPFKEGKYPSTVGYFEQRRCFAGFERDPQRIVMTRSATESQLSYSLPTRDDDRISFRIASREFNRIEHIVPMSHLVLLTTGNEFRVGALDAGALTPTSISARPVSNNGASHVRPVTVNNYIVYVARRGNHVRQMAYMGQQGYASVDLCLFSSHLFDFKNITDSAFSQAPVPIVWFVSSDGSLLSMTYIPEEGIKSWSRHTTKGEFESIAAIPEGDEDHLYCVIRREINGRTMRFVERMASQRIDAQKDVFRVDSGAKLVQENVTHISGLDWLEGETVAILADGAVMPEKVVTNGAIDLDSPASTIIVGIPYTANLKTLPVIINEDQGLGAGRMKNIQRIAVRVDKTSGLMAGPNFETLVEHKQRTRESPGDAPALYTGEIDLCIQGAWTKDGSICIRQSDPLPLTIQSLVLNVSV